MIICETCELENARYTAVTFAGCLPGPSPPMRVTALVANQKRRTRYGFGTHSCLGVLSMLTESVAD